jgi:hypothetical protein
MSGSAPNPFFTNPALGAGFSNLARIFAPGLEADLLAARVADLNQQMKLRGRIADDIAAAQDRMRQGLGADPAAAWREIFAGVLADPQAFGALARGAGVFAATQGVPESDLGRIVVGAGGNWRNTEGGSRYEIGTQDATRRRGQDIQAGTARDLARLEEEGRDRRMAPQIQPGNVVVVPPNSPLAPRANGQGRIEGNMRPQTYDQARAEQVGPFVAGEGTPEEQGRRRALVAPQVAAAEARPGAQQRPPAVDGADIRAIDEQIGAQLPSGDALDSAGAAWVRNRAAALMQQQGESFNNIPLAVQQALRDFYAQNPPRTDNRWNPFSSNQYGAPGTGGGARAASPDAPTAPTVPARPANVPPGSAWSPSRRMWRAPDGTLFTADGRPVS